MKKLALFFLLSSLAVQSVSACIYERDLHHYMFSVYSYNAYCKSLQGHTDQNVRYWSKYTGGKVQDADIREQLTNAGDTTAASNRLLTYLKGRRDVAGVEYLQKLQLMKKTAALNSDGWNYPTKQQLEQSKQTWAGLMMWALDKLRQKKTGLQSRYVLMAMRGAFYSGQRDKMAEIWTSFGKTVREADLHNQCEGYMASEWMAKGLTEKARAFYIKNGNINDLRATFPQNIGLKDLQTLYQTYPNSVAFPFVIQDYLNSLDADVNPGGWVDTLSADWVQRDSAARKELRAFVTFADGVLRSNGTAAPALWKSAQGYALYLLGNKPQALSCLYLAQKMRANQQMAYNTRSIILLIRAEMDEYNDKFEAYASKELVWLNNTARHEQNNADLGTFGFRNHYTDVMDRVVLCVMAPRYARMGKISTAAILTNMADELTLTQNTYNRRTSLVPRDSFSSFNRDYASDLFVLLDTASVEGVTAYYQVLKGGGTPLEQSLLPFCYVEQQYVAEIIATKLMRQFRFKSAIEYLKLVDDKFVQGMNILPYLAYSPGEPLWFNAHQLIAKKQKKGAADAKMRFCKLMLKQEDALQKATSKGKTSGKKFAVLAYNMATAYTQASCLGQCWALTHYSWTSAPDSLALADDPYLKRAKTLLRTAFNADASDDNKVRCLYALATLGRPYRCMLKTDPWFSYVNDPDYSKYMQMLARLADTEAFASYGIGRCDEMKDYMGAPKSAGDAGQKNE